MKKKDMCIKNTRTNKYIGTVFNINKIERYVTFEGVKKISFLRDNDVVLILNDKDIKVYDL